MTDHNRPDDEQEAARCLAVLRAALDTPDMRAFKSRAIANAIMIYGLTAMLATTPRPDVIRILETLAAGIRSGDISA